MAEQDKKERATLESIPLIINGVINTAWAILPSKLEEIMAVLQSKNSGAVIEMADKNKQTEPSKDRNYSVKDGIAEILIEGTLSKRMGFIQALSGGTSYENIQGQIQKAESDPAVRGIFYEYDSPGGNVIGMFNTADMIFNAKKQSMSFCNGLMASAAYITGSGADYVIASDVSAELANVGVVSVHFDKSKQYEKEGVRPTVISAGKFKAIGNPYERLKDKDLNHLKSKIDYMYSLAVNTVSRNRSVSVEHLVEKIGAELLIGEQAISAGLADEILTRPQAIERLKEMI